MGVRQPITPSVLEAQIPGIEWPLPLEVVPTTPVVLNLIEFCTASIGFPIEGYFHSFFRHHHLSFDRAEGLSQFITEVNLIFSRNGIAFELTGDGMARRIPPEGLRQALAKALFHTGDRETDRLLESARKLIASPPLDERRDALEKLWDAFERIKTLEPGLDKRAQTGSLLDKVASAEQLRSILDEDATKPAQDWQ